MDKKCPTREAHVEPIALPGTELIIHHPVILWGLGV